MVWTLEWLTILTWEVKVHEKKKKSMNDVSQLLSLLWKFTWFWNFHLSISIYNVLSCGLLSQWYVSSNLVQVPEGFEMAVRLMLPGEISDITCPPDYAYDRFKRCFFYEVKYVMVLAYIILMAVVSWAGLLMFLKVPMFSGKLSFLVLRCQR